MATPTIGRFTGFPPEAFVFFRELEENNSKAWFDEHRDTYDHRVRLPMELSRHVGASTLPPDGRPR